MTNQLSVSNKIKQIWINIVKCGSPYNHFIINLYEFHNEVWDGVLGV